jgi:hypothetical protein
MAMKYLRIIIKQNFIQNIEWLKHQTKGIRKKVKLYLELVLNKLKVIGDMNFNYTHLKT